MTFKGFGPWRGGDPKGSVHLHRQSRQGDSRFEVIKLFWLCRIVDSRSCLRGLLSRNDWYLLTLGARRGLSFLEQQPEVDPERLGVYGHSMGGSLAVYVAGCDERIKAAAPSVGGSGFRTQPNPLSGQQAIEKPNGKRRQASG